MIVVWKIGSSPNNMLAFCLQICLMHILFAFVWCFYGSNFVETLQMKTPAHLIQHGMDVMCWAEMLSFLFIPFVTVLVNSNTQFLTVYQYFSLFVKAQYCWDHYLCMLRGALCFDVWWWLPLVKACPKIFSSMLGILSSKWDNSFAQCA